LITFLKKLIKDSIPDILNDLGIELELYVVIGGKDVFESTMANLNQLVKACEGRYKIVVYKNEFFAFTSDQEAAVDNYCNIAGIPVRSYFLISGTSQTENLRVQSILTGGQGIESAPIFSKRFFTDPINKLIF